MATTYVELVVPGGRLYSGQAEMVACRSAGGDIAFLANHMAYIGLLEPGTLRIVGPQAGQVDGAAPAAGEAPGPRAARPPGGSEQTAGELRFRVEGGVVDVQGNRVVVACTSAERIP